MDGMDETRTSWWDPQSTDHQPLAGGRGSSQSVSPMDRLDSIQTSRWAPPGFPAQELPAKAFRRKSASGLSRKTIRREGRGSDEGEREKMGFWDLLYWPNDKIKQNAPDMTAVKNVCRSSCDLGYAAVKKVDNVVRVDGAQKVKEYLPDPQAREKIGRIATNIAKYGADAAVSETLKGLTGGVQIYRIVRDGLMDRPPYNHGSEKSNSKEMMEEMQKKMDKIQEEISNINYHNRILLERIKQYESPNERCRWEAAQKPEDVISLFMINGFTGGDFLDALLVPKVKSGICKCRFDNE